MHSYKFMQERHQRKPNHIEEKLDRALGNNKCPAEYLEERLVNYVTIVSNHSPILLHIMADVRTWFNRNFHFDYDG
ncbi:hypothetical protein LINPERPRIM_LOCUS11184 [Linum perenne]